MRSSPLIEYSNTVLLLCLWLGAITSIFSSLIGLFQQDIKKVIAYSTMSQLARIYNNIIIIIYRNQAVCVEFILLWVNNSQITKAHDYLNNHISKSFKSQKWGPSPASQVKGYFYILSFIINISEQRKAITISRWVGISEAIRLILIYFFFNLIIFISFCFIWLMFYQRNLIEFTDLNLYLLFPLSEKLREQSSSTSDLRALTSDPFFEWLAGVIDGDGYFNLSKKGIARLTITMDIRDKKALYDIKHKLGGSIYTIANANALKYQLSHKKGLITLLENVNGLIRNPARLLQMNKLCLKYGIELIYPKPLTFNNGWLSGFIDSDGSVYFSEVSGQVFISISQKNKYLLDPLIHIYGGRVDVSGPKIEAFKYVIYRKNELFNLIDNYFSEYPLRTKKLSRLNLIKEFYLKRISKNNKDIVKLNEWVKFKNKWEKYED